MATTFQAVFDSQLDMHVSLKLKELRNEFPPWLTRSVRDYMAKRDKMKKASTKNPPQWPAYKKLRNQFTDLIRKFTITTMSWLKRPSPYESMEDN